MHATCGVYELVVHVHATCGVWCTCTRPAEYGARARDLRWSLEVQRGDKANLWDSTRKRPRLSHGRYVVGLRVQRALLSMPHHVTGPRWWRRPVLEYKSSKCSTQSRTADGPRLMYGVPVGIGGRRYSDDQRPERDQQKPEGLCTTGKAQPCSVPRHVPRLKASIKVANFSESRLKSHVNTFGGAVHGRTLIGGYGRNT